MRRHICPAVLTLLCAAPLARATEFAILLGSRASDAATANFDAKVAGLPITGMTATFDPATLPDGATCIIDTNPTLPDGTPSLPGAFYFSISLQDNATGQFLHQFSPPISVNFSTTASNPKVSDFGMSRLLADDGTTPAWSTANTSLTLQDGNLCGTTDHLSIFALTPLASLPEPTTLLAACGLAIPFLRRRRI